jgi:hypothetical protein
MIFRPTWVEPRLINKLHEHPDNASHLILLKSPDWSTTLAIYPISTLSADNNLIVTEGTIHANVRRCVPGSVVEVWVVCAIARNRVEERDLVHKVVQGGRKLIGGQEYEAGRETIWDELGVCTWESLGNNGMFPSCS